MIHNDATAGDDQIRILQELEVREWIATDSDKVCRGPRRQRAERCQTEMCSRLRSGSAEQCKRRPSCQMHHAVQLFCINAPGDLGVTDLGAIEQRVVSLEPAAKDKRPAWRLS